MNNKINLSKLNPVRFQTVSWATFEKYVQANSQYYPYSTQKLPQQPPAIYAQKWEMKDTIRLQIEANFNGLQVELTNVDKSKVIPFSQDLCAKNKGAENETMNQYSLELSGIQPGCYVIRIHDGQENGIHDLSDTLIVAENHSNTVLIEYSNSTPEAYTIFLPGKKFSVRLEGRMRQLYAGMNDTDHKHSRSWNLAIGGAYGVTPFYDTLLKAVWHCDQVEVSKIPLSHCEGFSEL
jgi:hypothetical protein